jgi:hypothetical protein
MDSTLKFHPRFKAYPLRAVLIRTFTLGITKFCPILIRISSGIFKNFFYFYPHRDQAFWGVVGSFKFRQLVKFWWLCNICPRLTLTLIGFQMKP